MENILKVIKEFQTLMNSFEWFEKVKPYGLMLFFGGIGLVILNRFLIHEGFFYSIGFYGFLAGALVEITKENYIKLSQGFVIFGLYNLIFNVYQTSFGAREVSYSYFSFSNLIESLIFIGLGYLFFKVNSYYGKSTGEA